MCECIQHVPLCIRDLLDLRIQRQTGRCASDSELADPLRTRSYNDLVATAARLLLRRSLKSRTEASRKSKDVTMPTS